MEVTGTVESPIKLNFASYSKHFKTAFPLATPEGCFDAFFAQSLKMNPVFTPDEFNKRYVEEYSAAFGNLVVSSPVTTENKRFFKSGKPKLTADEKILRKREQQRKYDQSLRKKEYKARYMKEYNARKRAEKLAQREREGMGFVNLASTDLGKVNLETSNLEV